MYRARGNVAVLILAVALVVTLVSLAFLRLYHSEKSVDTMDTVITELKSNTTKNSLQSGMKWYVDEPFGFKMQIPENWDVENKDLFYDGVPHSMFLDLKSEGTYIASLVASGGHGGYCEPASGDVPFSPTNTCTSQEYIKVDKTIDEDFLYRSKLGNAYGKDPIVYLYCFVPKEVQTTSLYPIEVNKPEMGYHRGCYSGSIFIEFNATAESDFEKPIVKQLESALMTIEYE